MNSYEQAIKKLTGIVVTQAETVSLLFETISDLTEENDKLREQANEAWQASLEKPMAYARTDKPE